MKRKGITIFIPIGFVILLLLVLLSLPLAQAPEPQIQFVDREHNFSLSLYYDEYTDRQYLFLPSFLSVSDLTLSCPWYLQAELTSGSQTPVDISEAPLDTDLFLTVKALGQKTQQHTLQILQGSAKKTIAITAQGSLMEYITADKANKGNVSVAILDETGTAEFAGTSTLSGRGNGTWTWEKKPLNLDFSQKISFGPFLDIQTLCLFAEYTDESKLRNAIAFQAGALQEIPFTSPYCYADIYVNGQYLGLYGLATKDAYQSSGNVRAVFEVPSEENTVHFRTDMGNPIKVHLGSQMEIEARLKEMESAISAGDWNALGNIADLKSFAKKYVLDEFLCNMDTSFASQYYYLDASGVVHCMLPWDYEWSLFSRNTHFQGLPERQIAGFFFSYCWWQDLLAFPEFREALCDELSQNYTKDFLSALDQYTENCIAEMEASRSIDLIRWPGFSSNEQLLSGFTDVSQFRTLFQEYYPRRISFLQDYWADPESYVEVTLLGTSPDSDSFPSYKSSYYFPRGTILAQQENQLLRATPSRADLRFLGWYSSSGVPLSEIGPVTEDVALIGAYDFQMPEDYIDGPLWEAASDPVPEAVPEEAPVLPTQEETLPTIAETEPLVDETMPAETPAPNPEEAETPDTDLPPQDAAPEEMAETASDAPISTFSAVSSMIFFLFFFCILFCEYRRNHRQKEVYPSESKDKSLSK